MRSALESSTVRTDRGPLEIYVARPEGGRAEPRALIVAHDERGLDDHVVAVCHRFAREGYVAVAPDLLRTSGRDVAPASDESIASATNEGVVADLVATRDFVRGLCGVGAGQIGIVGFGFGGFAAFLGACRAGIGTAVSFYGSDVARPRPGMRVRAAVRDVSRNTAPILCMLGAADESIRAADAAQTRARLQEAGVEHEMIVYPRVRHGFFRDGDAPYHREAAEDAWRRTLDWLGRYV